MFERSPASRLRWAAGGLLTGMVACSGSAPETVAPDEPDRAEAIAAAEAQEAQAAATPDIAVGPGGVAPRPEGEAPQVLLVWDNISDLYRSFFSHTEPLTRLSSDLVGYANGPVNLYVRWDQEAFSGAIRLRILPDTLVAPQLGEGGLVPLQALAPLTTALASYRSDVSSRFDIRIESFEVALESFSGARHCVFPIVGKSPPDGRLLSPCVWLNGQERCGTPKPEGVLFSPDVASDLRACLTPKG